MGISWSEKGSGHPLLLLHGFCETRVVWLPLLDYLAKRYRVIVPDLPGFGESSPVPGDTDIDAVGRFFLQWLSEKEIKDPVVIGHSLGGYVTLAMARQAPDSLSAIGLFHSTAAPDQPEKKRNRDKSISFVERHGVQPYTDGFVSGLFHDESNPWVAKMKKIAALTRQQSVTGYTAAMRDRKSAMDFVAAYEKPILFVAGEFDELIPAKALEEQSETAKHPVFRLIKGAAHMGMLENEPESRNAIENFMKFAVES